MIMNLYAKVSYYNIGKAVLKKHFVKAGIA